MLNRFSRRRAGALVVALATITVAGPAAGSAQASWTDTARLYAPQFRFHPGEQYYPTTPEWFAARSSLKFGNQNTPDFTVTGVADPRRLGYGLGSIAPYTFHHFQTSGGQPYRDVQFNTRHCTRPYQSLSQTPHCYAAPQKQVGWTTNPDRRALQSSEGFFLDLSDAPAARAGQRTGITGAPTVPTYFQAENLTGGGYSLTFWFFTAYDRFDGVDVIDPFPNPVQTHEGDWERVSIRFNASLAPQEVALNFHDCVYRYPWGQGTAFAADAAGFKRHPIVYVARDSHGVHPTWDNRYRRTCNGPKNGVILRDDVSTGGVTWNSWNLVADAKSRPWYGFGGAWGREATGPTWAGMGGDLINTLYTGPMGPGPFKDPSPWDELNYGPKAYEKK